MRPLFALLLACLSNWATAQLNGTYTINGGGGGDYTTFTAAVADLVAQGVSGPVVMNVAPGTYTEQVSFPTIGGTSALNTVTFQSQGLDNSLVTIRHAASAMATNNFVVQFEGADHVRFLHLTMERFGPEAFGDVFRFRSGVGTPLDPSTHIEVRHCRLLRTGTAGYNGMLVASQNFPILNEAGIVFANSYFNGGQFAFGSPGNPGDEWTIIDNVIENVSTGIQLFQPSAVLIEGNTITTTGPAPIATAIRVTCDCPAVVVRNRVVTIGQGIDLTVASTALQPALVANNMVALPSGTARGIRLIGTNAHVDILHNSVRVASGRTLEQLSGAASNNIRLINNALQATGQVFNVPWGTAFSEAHSNVLRKAGALLGSWNGTAVADIPALQALSGLFADCLDADPGFASTTDLHIGMGSPCLQQALLIPSISIDVDGDARPMPVGTDPDIGADESNACPFIGGTYIIGASGVADFPTFTAAINAMVNCGINAPVLFLVEDGTYTEQIALPNVPGNSNVNTITFRGQSLNSALAILTATTGSVLPTVLLTGADRVTFEHLTIRRTGPAGQPGLAVDFEHTVANGTTRSEYPTLRNCRISTTSTISSTIRNIAQNEERTVSIEDCIITGGLVGVDVLMDNEISLFITGNTFSGQGAHAILCHSAGAGDPELYIQGNDILGPAGVGAIGIAVEHNSNNLEVTGNRVLMPGVGDAALRLSANGGLFWTWVRNNMLICTGGAKGMVLEAGTTGLDISYNSISVQAGEALEFLGAATGCRFVANAMQGTGLLLRGVVGTAPATADHNLFHTPGAEVAFWAGQSRSMGCLRTVTGQHEDSFRADPRFVDPLADLHVQADSPCKGNGSPSVNPMTDFDGTPRALPLGSTPDIGAHEVAGACTTLAGTYLIGPSMAADFATIGAAVNALKGCGISGAVLFQIENGTYTEQVVLDRIKGSSTANTITFRSLAMDSTVVIWQWPHTSASNHVVALEGADHLRFEHLTMRRTAGAGRSDVVVFRGSCDPSINVQVRRCRLIGSGTLTAGLGALVGHTDAGSANTGILLIHSRFQDAPLGVGWDADGDADALTIQFNIVQNCRTAVQLQRLAAPASVRNNTITLTNAGATGIHLVNNSTSVSVDENRLRLSGTGTGYGMLLNGNTPPGTNAIRLRNNSIIALAGNIGIQVLGSADRVDILQNSVRSNTARGLWINASGGAGSRLIGNILSSNNAVGLYRIGTFTFAQAERNILHSSVAPFIATWGGDHATIGALQAATGQHTNSFSVDPRFYDPANDLRTYAMEADMGSMPIAGILYDNAGLLRDATNPDIGAHEFQPQLWNESFNTCAAALSITSTGSGMHQWIYRDRMVVALFNDNGQNLGTVNMNVYVNNAAVRQSLIGQYYMDRNWHLSTQNAITAPVLVRLFHSGDEFSTYTATDPAVNVYADAGVAHYAGPMEDCALMNNPAGNIWTPLYPAAPALEPRIQGNGGTHGYTAVISDDGELYITTMGLPLPVELLSFTGQRLNEREVELRWTTATERDNAGFELWRMIDGEDEFVQVGWVDGNGNSQQLMHYTHIDPNHTERLSYYRLRQVDYDGTSKDSPVVAVQGGRVAPDLVLAPNPARDRFSVLGAVAAIATVELIDGRGGLVRRWNEPFQLEVHDLPSGIYLVRVTYATGGMDQARLVLQR